MVPKSKTWADNWNDIIRSVFFKDQILKDLMLVPDGTTITQFIDRYFIEDLSPDELIIDEKVRVAYYDTEGSNTGNKNVKGRYKEMDIYVHSDVLHNATKDRLQNRCHLIAERIKYQLLREFHICKMHFEYEDEYNQWTKVTGYKRYHIAFSYKTTV